jgi:hypothetical protein
VKAGLAATGLALVSLVVAVAILREPEPPTAGPSSREATNPDLRPAVFPNGVPSLPARNPFEYGGTDDVRVSPPPPRTEAPSRGPRSAEAAPSAPGVRLVGFVRQGDTLGAALVILEEVVVLAPGESWGGYTLLGADAEEGVRLAGPEGEIGIKPPG